MELVTADRVVTGRPGEVLDEAGVLYEGNRIEWVGRVSELTADRAAGAHRSHYPGATILPGLIDSHVHLGFDGGPDPVQRMERESDSEQLVLMLFSARELLGAGVTTGRDLGARSFLDVTVKRAIQDGLAEGPRLLSATRPITVTGGHCWFMGGETDGLDAIRHQVRYHHKMGADLIKVMATGGHLTKGSVPWHAQFHEGEMRVLVDDAHRLEKKVAAHAHGTDGIRNAAAARSRHHRALHLGRRRRPVGVRRGDNRSHRRAGDLCLPHVQLAGEGSRQPLGAAGAAAGRHAGGWRTHHRRHRFRDQARPAPRVRRRPGGTRGGRDADS